MRFNSLALLLIPFLVLADDAKQPAPTATSLSQGQNLDVTILDDKVKTETQTTSTAISDNVISDDKTKTTKLNVTDSKASESKAVPALKKRDLVASETGYGIGGFGGGIGGIGGGYGGGGHQGGFGGGFGGGHLGHEGFGGGKSLSEGKKFGSNYGGLNNQVKVVDDKFQKAQHATKGFKGNQAFKGSQGYLKNDAGHINKANKKGHFGSVGQFSKAAKNDGSVYGKNNHAIKFAKGTKFGAKGAHKKGHSTKGFHNTHHKDEYSKNHVFHDDKNAIDYFDKFGDEGAFKSDLTGKTFLNANHANVLNKNNQANQGNFVSGHHNLANKGVNEHYGNKGQLGHNAHYGNAGGNNYASGFGKGLHSNNQYGGHFGGGGFGKQGGFGGTGHQGGFGGGLGYGGGGGGYGGGYGGGLGGFGR